MSKIIADTYEIQQQIGSGGGGIVFLGWHLRMNKQIVLKADKRTLNTKAEILRREVDILKELHNTYIPKVYDFVQDDDVVYTVMDFIEGESLDGLLKRGERVSQPDVIKWACQLLTALDYLHSRPPHGILHGDIKPANIMARPDGSICLIDFNIALALGEDGAVRAGHSRGYASPEHYGIEYGSREKSRTGERFDYGKDREGLDLTEETDISGLEEVTDREGTDRTEENQRNISALQLSDKSSASGPVVMLDVRSDIYSLGATLYHLLSGQRPDPDAVKVEPLGSAVCSPAVSKIIQKAMALDPDKRYQTAKEMLHAFRQLHRQDIRTIRHRRRAVISAVMLSAMFLSGGAAAFIGMKQLEQIQSALALSEYSANQLAQGDTGGAIRLALEAIPSGESIFDGPVTSQSQKALTDALGVYDLADGFQAVHTIHLPSAPFAAAISPDGAYFAAVYQYEAAFFDIDTGRQLGALPTLESALCDVVFVNDTQVIFAGALGVTAYDIEQGKILWTGQTATTLALSGDKSVVAAVNRDESIAKLYQVEDGVLVGECSFGEQHMKVAVNDIFANPADRIFALNETGTLLAVSFSDGGLRIFDLKNRDEDMIIYETSPYGEFQGGFFERYFAFGADKSDESIFGLVDTEDGVYVGEYESRDQFFVKADRDGIYFANGNLLVSFDPDTLEQEELAYTEDKNITGFSVGDGYALAATEDNGFVFYDRGANPVSPAIWEESCDFLAIAGGHALMASRNVPFVRVLKRESHDEAKLMSYDARYLHDEARVSQDRNTVMLFDYEEFCIWDMDGDVVARENFPDCEHIYDQQFRKGEEDSWLEVIWYDGAVRCYSARDGSIIRQTEGEPPSKDLYEEFYTDKYRIESPLHGIPQVYDLGSGQKVADLEEGSYLTYVTQIGEFLITEYITAEGERYGLLLDHRFEPLAYLPDLCDIAGDMLIFDDGSGNLRQCRLYSLQELKALGEAYLQNVQGGNEG